jgi:hypothetical protein
LEFPKKPMTAYIHFGAARRAMVEATNPDMSYGEAAKCIGQLWLAASVTELQPFIDAALADKARYKREEAMVFEAKLSINAVRVRLQPLVLGTSDRIPTHMSWKELYRDFSVWTAASIREDASYDKHSDSCDASDSGYDSCDNHDEMPDTMRR